VKTVQLLGKGLTIGSAPVLSPGVERWGTNDLIFQRFAGEFDDWTRWFDLHESARIQARRPETYAWYQRQDKPIVLLEHDPAIPASVAYPRAVIQEAFGRRGRLETGFTSALDWMLALAIWEGFTRIELCWFPFTAGYERSPQRESARRWITRAEDRGIDVVVQGDSTLIETHPLYGYDSPRGVTAMWPEVA
jgi:hypothetical protein